MHPQHPELLKNPVYGYYVLDDELVCLKDKQGKLRIIVPHSLREFFLNQYHNHSLSATHMSTPKLIKLFTERFAWIGMIKDIKHWVRCCGKCVQHKKPQPNHHCWIIEIRKVKDGVLFDDNEILSLNEARFNKNMRSILFIKKEHLVDGGDWALSENRFGVMIICNWWLTDNQRAWLKSLLDIRNGEGGDQYKALEFNDELIEVYAASNKGKFDIRSQLAGDGIIRNLYKLDRTTEETLNMGKR